MTTVEGTANVPRLAGYSHCFPDSMNTVPPAAHRAAGRAAGRAGKSCRSGPRSPRCKGLNSEGSRIQAFNCSLCRRKEEEAEPKVTGVREPHRVLAG